MRNVLFLFAALAAATAVQAQQTRTDTIYRCTNALGALTIQNGIPCPKGNKQEVQVVESPMVIPRYEAPPSIVTGTAEPEPAPEPEPQAPAIERPQAPPPEQLAAADRLPPPPLFQCNTWDNQHYLSEDADPKPRCVQLATTGLAGDPNRAGGQACEMKYDLCSRVPDESACDGWKQRQREIESTWRYAPGGDKARLQQEFARVTKILNDTTCGGG